MAIGSGNNNNNCYYDNNNNSHISVTLLGHGYSDLAGAVNGQMLQDAKELHNCDLPSL